MNYLRIWLNKKCMNIKLIFFIIIILSSILPPEVAAPLALPPIPHLIITPSLIVYSHRLCKLAVATSVNEALLASLLNTSTRCRYFLLFCVPHPTTQSQPVSLCLQVISELRNSRLSLSYCIHKAINKNRVLPFKDET